MRKKSRLRRRTCTEIKTGIVQRLNGSSDIKAYVPKDNVPLKAVCSRKVASRFEGDWGKNEKDRGIRERGGKPSELTPCPLLLQSLRHNVVLKFFRLNHSNPKLSIPLRTCFFTPAFFFNPRFPFFLQVLPL